jgi:hypothetical protein
MDKLLANLNRAWNTLPKDIPMLIVEKGTGTHFMVSVDSTQIAFHSTPYKHNMPIKQAVALDGFTLEELIETINEMGYKAQLDPVAKSKGFGSRKASVLMETTDAVMITPYTLRGFTSNLWQMLYPIARLLEESSLNTDEAVKQMYAGVTSGKFVDYWATFFKVKRIVGESDAQLQKRVFMALTNMKTNNVALQQLVQFTINGSAEIRDIAPAEFEVLVDPSFIPTANYIRSIINEVKAGGVDYFLNYSRANTEDYKATFKNTEGVDLENSDISRVAATLSTLEEAPYGYTQVNPKFTIGFDTLGIDGSDIMHKPEYLMSDVATTEFGHTASETYAGLQYVGDPFVLGVSSLGGSEVLQGASGSADLLSFGAISTLAEVVTKALESCGLSIDGYSEDYSEPSEKGLVGFTLGYSTLGGSALLSTADTRTQGECTMTLTLNGAVVRTSTLNL